MDFDMSCCFTGHRFDKLGFSERNDDPVYAKMYERLVLAVSDAIANGYTRFYTGMATGFDIIAAEHIALIKRRNKNITLTAVIPFSGQADRFPPEWKKRYDALLCECDGTETLNDGYRKWAYDQRNRYMVDRCRRVIAYFDGSDGGTANTVKYALRNCREVINIYENDPLASRRSTAYYEIISDPADKE